MLITRLSPLSGFHTLDLPLTPRELLDIGRGGSPYIVAPHLLPSQREFLLTGLTPSDWDRIFYPGSSDADDREELAQGAGR